ncbi:MULTISPECIES: GNAT family N-acetyltransferase [unclassified Mesorhizobium]|uniref:GNAT family N-acetyltransferase n=1 Tax=unclassified Mesorhizobium TaxID=325217 RepID=UPI0009648742|nr:MULTISPECIES: GNAT family N-acetyltransferase [unclassified Mesorhizobium]MBN9256502.1 GNAT family N-acetyltransferase [Mesorhizobium sp.]MBN9275798.1 GNAT family N-acetyltransferase [Mesorhizobium sp.]OJX74609.1 MAG: GNAT family N-acetyltransferase [Mesorhizobium sp. 65-26]
MVDLLVTYMEMSAPDSAPPKRAPLPGAVVARERLDPESYLPLYRAVGEPVNWDQRLRMPLAELRAFLQDTSTHIYVMRLDGRPIGLCEFAGVGGQHVELTHFGLVPDEHGRGLGSYLLDSALRAVWSTRPRRVWLHTDTCDDARAQPTYGKAGFVVFDRRVETFPD